MSPSSRASGGSAQSLDPRRRVLLALGVLSLVVLAAAILAWIGLFRLQAHSRHAEPLWLLLDIASAQDGYLSRAKDGRYLNISGTNVRPIQLFYPGSHARGSLTLWTPDQCPEGVAGIPCQAFGLLGVKVNGGAVSYRYGGGAAFGLEECRSLARANGAPDPPPAVDGKPCFVLVAVDGEGGAVDRFVLLSWTRQVIAAPLP